MKTLVALAAMMILTSGAWAALTASVFLADENTPLALVDPNTEGVYRDIMVGTRLAIFIESDVSGYGAGGLFVPWRSEQRGSLSARGASGLWSGFRDSCLEAAGWFPSVWQKNLQVEGRGIDFASDVDADAGRWFVFDYHALSVGTCDIELYDYDENPYTPIRVLSFGHVLSRDFHSGDAIVNFADFALLASQWSQAAVVDPNAVASPDLNADGSVDGFDLAQFSDYWLERTDFTKPGEPADPNIAASGL